MILGQCELINYCSYEHLTFDFTNLGLCLVHGATGSGKSTLLDSACWILFGQTPKGISVDDIRSWNNLDKVTSGTLSVQLDKKEITVYRTRGPNRANNDLYWIEEGETNRGKDITETQRLLNQRIRCDYDMYVVSSYFCEYNATTSFFVSTSKQQRELFEILASLEFPEKLAERVTDEKKKASKDLQKIEIECSKTGAKLDQTKSNREGYFTRHTNWCKEQAKIIDETTTKIANFDEDKKRKIEELEHKSKQFLLDRNDRSIKCFNWIKELEQKINDSDSRICKECGNSKDPIDLYKQQLDSLMQKHDDIHNEVNPYEYSLKTARSLTNDYSDYLEKQLKQVSPYFSQIETADLQIAELQDLLKHQLTGVQNTKNKISSLEQLYALSFELRGQLLQKTVEDIEQKTNSYLETYFHSEFRVHFFIEESDKLTTSIQKNGISCVYKQLSKDQKNLLKLTFALSVMEASANRHFLHFDTIFLDEPTDGFDEELKIKAFSLLESLSLKHGSVIVVEHNETLKSMFNKRFLVTLDADSSNLIEDVI